MNNKIRHYVDDILEGYDADDEFIEELKLNLSDKYHDLLSDGLDSETAYKEVIIGIGDIDELVGINRIETTVKDNSQRRSIQIGVAVFLFIISVVPIILFDELIPELEVIGLLSMLIMVAIGVFLLIILPPETGKTSSSRTSKSNKPIKENKSKSKMYLLLNMLVYVIATILFVGLSMQNVYNAWIVYVVAYATTLVLNLTFNNQSKPASVIITFIASILILLATISKIDSVYLFVSFLASIIIVNIFFTYKGAHYES